MSLGEIRVWPHETNYIGTVSKTRLVIKSSTGWDNSMLLATYAGWKSTFSAHWSHDPIVLAIPTVTCWLWQSLKCLNKLTDFKAYLLYIVPSIDIYNMNKIFCKHDFCNDHVITKIMKIFCYENFEIYDRLTTYILKHYVTKSSNFLWSRRPHEKHEIWTPQN